MKWLVLPARAAPASLIAGTHNQVCLFEVLKSERPQGLRIPVLQIIHFGLRSTLALQLPLTTRDEGAWLR